MIGIALEWRRPTDGVDLVDRGPKRVEGTTLLTEHEVGGLWYQPRSDRQTPVIYGISDLENPVAIKFINARSDEKRAAFFSMHGFLFEQQEASQEDTGRRQDDFLGFFAGVSAARSPSALKSINEIIEQFSLQPSLEFATQPAKLVLRTQSLFAYMAMEGAFALSVGAQLALCENCAKAFLTGSMTGRRSHAKYCSDRCRVAAMRKRNKGE